MPHNKPIDWTKPIETVDGRPARVLATDLATLDERHVAVAVMTEHGEEVLAVVDDFGRVTVSALVRNKLVKREGWINLYRGENKARPDDRVVGRFMIFDTQAAANEAATTERIACVRIEWEE